MKKSTLFFSFVLTVALMATGCSSNKAKYVFYFIGDGMGFSHVALAEAYLAQERGDSCGQDPLTFTQFPVLGMATTFSASNPITCSSAAGTALATGYKTKNHMLGMNPDSLPLKSIAYKIHEAGYKVGIMTTVGINHATPAAFYAHNVSRSDYYPIGLELAESGFEFFGGGGYLHPTGSPKLEEPLPYLGDAALAAGYTFARGLDEFAEKKCDKIILTRNTDYEGALPYRFGCAEDELNLAQVVDAAIQVLENGSKGFFLMAEGGLIDYAAHSNNTLADIFETLDFDKAVAVAYEFYKKHPKQTLIVVTADHETGGVALGRDKGYRFDLTVFDEVKTNESSNDVEEYMNTKAVQEEYSEKAHIGWTTGSHTGAPVPVWAVGAGSEQFAGRQDNTDLPRKICKAMGIAFE